MRILAICGSPREGNTEFMLRTLLDSAKEQGAETELILLSKIKLFPCIGCDICFNDGEPCPLEDDFPAIVEKLKQADIIVLGSPNYFRNVSGIMKNFMDRTNSLFFHGDLDGKKAVLVSVGGQDESETLYCENAMREFCRIHKMIVDHKIIAQADAPGQIKENNKTIARLVEMGKEIVKC